jgi:PPM family protein phosphatase
MRTLILVDQDRAHIAHVGDSRAYLFRDGELKQLTEDHTLVARMVKEGRIRQEEAEHHPQRSIITRALGVDADVAVDVDSLDLREGDRLMLCSDGLSSVAPLPEIARILEEEPDPQAAADALVALANEAGGEDNITVVLLDVTDRPVSRRAIPSTKPPPAPAPSVAAAPPWRKRLVIAAIIVALLAVGGYLGVSYLVDHSWYVGTGADGAITVYKGIPEEVFGVSLREVVEANPDLTLDQLPPNLRENFRDGRKADSLEEARAIVEDLEQRAREFQNAGPGKEDGTKPTPSPEPDRRRRPSPKRDQRKN